MALYVDNGDGTYTVTTANGTFTVTEEAFNEFISNMDTTITDLDYTRGMVTDHVITRIRGELDFVPKPSQFQRVDAYNLKLGTFDDAKELGAAYKENFYKGRADQIERIYHGYDTGKAVSQEIITSYMDEDGNVAADVSVVDSEFGNRHGINDQDVNDASHDNETQGGDDPSSTPSDDHPSSTQDL